MIIFLTLDLFLSAAPKGWEESVAFLDAELYAKSFEKKFIQKIKYFRSSPDPKNSWCGYQQRYNFFSVFADFQKLRLFFFIISKGKIFRAHRRKILISVITGEPVLTTIALLW